MSIVKRSKHFSDAELLELHGDIGFFKKVTFDDYVRVNLLLGEPIHKKDMEIERKFFELNKHYYNDGLIYDLESEEVISRMPRSRCSPDFCYVDRYEMLFEKPKL